MKQGFFKNWEQRIGHTVPSHLNNAIHSVIQLDFIILSSSYSDSVDFSQIQIHI